MSESSRPRQPRNQFAPAIWADELIDGVGWIVAIIASVLLSGSSGGTRWDSVAWLAAVTLAVYLAAAWWFGVYRRRIERGSFHEFKALLGAVFVVALLVGLPAILFADVIGVPRATLPICVPVALVILAGSRYVRRIRQESDLRPRDSAQPTLVYGAGDLGRHLVKRMLSDGMSPYRPVGIVDDDPGKANLRVEGVPVLGTGADLRAIVERTGARALIISIARANAALLRSITDSGEAEGLRVLVFPPLDEVLEGKSRLRDIRDIAIEDLIGRHPIETDVESMAGYLTGKRVLVTGAGGSIGTELSRQIVKYAPEELIMLDRDETGLQSTQLLIEGNGLLLNKNIVLADIRDTEALTKLFEERRPQVVFHAAALKHLPMLERFPAEAWKTNVMGTLNVLEAAMAVNVETFVNVSTDKAADPTSVLGYSKQLAERLTSWAAVTSSSRYLSVRFGNVLGSRGSLVPVLAAMIDAGGPVTVTDPEATRFFMTIPEASHLVVQAGGIGRPGEVLILDMGQPVRILDIAERMITQSGRDVAIVYTGLRDGEKLHEDLVGAGEEVARPIHPKISHTTAVPISPNDLSRTKWLAEITQATR